MEYAVISVKNQQMLVKPGAKLTLLGSFGNQGDLISDVQVLAYKDKDLEVGTPYLTKKVDLKIVSQSKTDKVTIFKYKSKSRYRRKTGHRQETTIVEVVAEKAVAAKPKVAKAKK